MNRKIHLMRRIKTFMQANWMWVTIFTLYQIAWIIPFGWMRDQWQQDYTLLSSQPFILPIFFLILHGWQDVLRNHFEELKQWSRHTGKRTKNGSLTLLLIGCVLFFFAHFSRLSLAAILGLVLMLLGVFVRVYNKQFLKIITKPILYLFLIIPWLPETATGKINSLGVKIHGLSVTKFFQLTGKYVTIDSELITINGSSIPTPIQLYGFQGIVATLIFVTGYGIFKRLSNQRILSMNLTGIGVAFIVHQIRFITVCSLLISNPVTAAKIASLNCWIFTIPSILLTFLSVHLIAKIRRPIWLDIMYQKSAKINKFILKILDTLLSNFANISSKAIKLILKIINPITWTINIILNIISKIFNSISTSNKQVESAIRKTERKIQNRRKK